MSIQSEEGLKQAYKMLSQGEPAEAKKLLADILEFNLDNKEIDFAVWCCSYWIDFIKKLAKFDFYERGESLLFQWKTFEEAFGKKKEIFARTIFSVQTGIFSLALDSFSSVSQESTRLSPRLTAL